MRRCVICPGRARTRCGHGSKLASSSRRCCRGTDIVTVARELGQTLAHERYLAAVKFVHSAQNIAFTEYRSAVRDAHERVERFNDALRAELETGRMRPVVEALMSLRGIGVVAAITLVVEPGDIRRFTHPRELMAFLGLVPSEHSSGASRRLGAITKCGNSYRSASIPTSGMRSSPRPKNNRSLRPGRPGERRPKRTEVHYLIQSVQSSTARNESFSAAVDSDARARA